jgi:predicted MPP superfamily phosphohydrolase
MGPGAKNVEVRRFRVPVPGLPAELEGLRIAHVSDLYAPAGATGVARAAELLAREPADVVVLTGDLLDGKGAASLASLPAVLGPFQGRKATIAVAGEHDLQAGVTVEQLREALRAQGVTLLSDERLPVPAGRASVTFVGLAHPSDPAKLEASTIGARGRIEIWAAHAPNLVAAAPPKGFERAAFALAGHTRGGQLRLPFTDGLTPEGTAPFVAGWYTVRGRLIYVNRGLGTVGVPARLGSPPELTMLTLHRALVDGEIPLPDTAPSP